MSTLCDHMVKHILVFTMLRSNSQRLLTILSQQKSQSLNLYWKKNLISITLSTLTQNQNTSTQNPNIYNHYFILLTFKLTNKSFCPLLA